MIRKVLGNLGTCWRTLVVADLLFKAISVVLLVPLVGLLFQLFLALSGRSMLADTDIALFLLHPIGWIAWVMVGGAVVSLFTLEQAVLMTICIGAERQQPGSAGSVIQFVAARSGGLLRLAWRVMGYLGLLAIPFLAAGGVVFWLLLSEHDINYYLSNRPAKYWIAVAVIGIILLVLTGLLVRRIVSWALAIQQHLYEGMHPRVCLGESQRRSIGHRMSIAIAIVLWTTANLAIGFLLSLLVVTVGKSVVPMATGSLWTLGLAIGTVIAVTTVANLATSMLANMSLASLLGLYYLKISGGSVAVFPKSSQGNFILKGLAVTRARVVATSIIGVLVAMLIGLMAIHNGELEDRVEITAHRGGAAAAPENTLAAIRRAILDGTDWVEIDVQETKDGVVVVAHDSDLMKVAGNPVRIWEATADELRAIDIGSFFSGEFSSERVPTLDEVLTVCKGKVGVNIELKYYGHDQELEKRVVELVERHGMQSEIAIMSLKQAGIARIRALRPEWTVGLLTAVAAGDLTLAEADFLAVNSSIADRSFVKSAHRRSKTVSVWTVNDGYEMSAMISRGVDNLITDRPDLARQVLAERAGMSPLERLMVELAFYLGIRPESSGPR